MARKLAGVKDNNVGSQPRSLVGAKEWCASELQSYVTLRNDYCAGENLIYVVLTK